MDTKHFKKKKFMAHDKKTEVSDKRMKSNWNNKPKGTVLTETES